MKKLWLFPMLLAAGLLHAAAQPMANATQPPTPPAGSITLDDCYKRAVQISETLAITEQDIAVIEAQFHSAVGGILPDISWQRTDLWQDTSGVAESSGGVQGTLLRSHRPESFFQVRQPLFHGFRELNAGRGLGKEREAARFNRDQAMLDVLSSVAEVFYVALDLQQELDVLAGQHQLNEDRLNELQRRVKLGKSRESEVLSSEVELASLDALIEDTRQRWATARDVLFFLTQVPSTVPLADVKPVPSLMSLDSALMKSTARPDLLSLEKHREAQRYNLKYARGDYAPSLDILGNYYTERVGFNEDVKWDALLSLNVPIFSGLRTKAGVDQAKAELKIAELSYSRQQRLVRQQVSTAHQSLRYTLSQSQFYTRAVDLAQRNYKVQQDEYRLGLINNLQVIQVMNDLQDLHIRKIRTDASVRLNDIRLRVAMGQGL
jgi:outer membrane protein